MTPTALFPSRVATAAVVAGALTGSFLLLGAGSAAAAPATAPGRAPAAAPAAPALAPAAVTPAPPGGKLAPAGCTGAAGATTCAIDLWAMAGSTAVLGTSIPIWGFSTSGAPGSATAPGPQLAVPQDADVTITVHNSLSEPVSLALPGQAAADLVGRAGDDVTGAAPGATATYRFTAHRAGTFAYEAGHTPDGARQVAMGLAGALVVVAGDGSAYGRTYDDDGVLVLSEIDPALNANPTGFDMRAFKPAYRLINGKPFPASDPIPTDQGRTVLLRYVNVGSQTHAMGVLGRTQFEVAQDGHALPYPSAVGTESIDPGQTLDTLVTMPTGPDARFAVYEAGQHLDNAGQNNGDPRQVAFGGMLTFLDTNPPPPSTDGVGPVSQHIAVSPNPSNGLAPVTVTADVSDATTGGSMVSQAEFVVDDAVDVGVGFGVAMTGTFGGPSASVTGTLPVSPPAGATCATVPTPVALDCLPAGKHSVFVRAQDSAGNWGVIGSVILNLPKTGPQTTGGSVTPSPANGAQDVALSATGDDSAAGGTIDGAEYFVDTAGAAGSGTALTLNRSATVVSEDVVVPGAAVKAMGEGTHHLLVHSHDALGLWGPVLDVPLTVDLTGPGVDADAVGPNPSNGLIGDRSNPTSLVVTAQITDRDAGGAVQSPLVAAEAFLDRTTGAPGSGLQLIAVDGRFDSTSEAVYGLIPLSQVKALADGTHQVYVRGKDAAGNWGNLVGAKLLVDKVAPVLGAASATPNPTNAATAVTVTAPLTELNTLGVAEFWFGTADPGVGRGSSVPVSVVNGKVVLTVPLAGVTPGTQQLNIRVQDQAGNWSKGVSTSLTVSKTNAIFASTFESTTPADWSARTGGVSNTAAAASRTTWEPASTQGLQVTLPTTVSKAAFVTDTTPTAETGYHVRFVLNRNTLTSGTAAALTVFDARSANGSVFALQFRTVGTQAQLRTVLSRSGRLGPLTGAWVPVATGARMVQLDWTAATAGSVKLTVDGTGVQTQTGDTSALRVETGWLGVSAGWATSSAGTAWFDSFASARNSLP